MTSDESNLNLLTNDQTLRILSHHPIIAKGPTKTPTNLPTNHPTQLDPGTEMEVIVEVTTDQYPEETSWTIIDMCTEQVMGSSPTYDTTETTFEPSIFRLPAAEYKFEILDTYGDGEIELHLGQNSTAVAFCRLVDLLTNVSIHDPTGMCCSYGQGSCELDACHSLIKYASGHSSQYRFTIFRTPRHDLSQWGRSQIRS